MCFFDKHTLLTINRNTDSVTEFRFHIRGLKLNLTGVASLMTSIHWRDVQIWFVRIHDFVFLQLLFILVPGEGHAREVSVNLAKKLHYLIFKRISPALGHFQDRIG